MKKFLSLFVAFVLGATLVSAKTIYCKMEQSWWKADGAAVGCHSWGTPGPGTTWPGVRMVPVAGQTDLWSIELDTEKVQNVIFTRVNGSGNIADWGAKTKDQKIPTDDKNLFTITSSSAVWGDPGCDGEWSVYGTSPIVTEPKVTDIAIAGDKYVGTELTFTATVEGFSADPVIIYEVKAKDGEYTQAQGGKFTPTAAGDYTVKANAFYQPKEGDAEEASKEVNFTVTVKEYYLVGYINGANSGCEGDYEALHAEYKFVDGQLKVTFTETSYVFVKTSDNNHWFLSESYVAPAAKVEATLAEGKAEKVGVNGNVEVTFTLTENQDGTLTLAYKEATAPVVTYKDTVYYVAGNFTNWATDMKTLPTQAELPADSVLEFKQVMTRTVLADGVFARNDTIWYGQANEGNYMTRESNAWKLDGANNVFAKTDIAGIYTFSLNENGEFVLGWPDSPATKLNNVKAQDGKRYNILGQPVNETYRGIVIMNGKTYLQ